jgi:hypothetical protein
MTHRFWLLALALLAVAPVMATDFYVDNVVGNDTFDGTSKTIAGATGPFRTITRAAKAGKAGDTVHVNPTGVLYRESANLYGLKGGEAGKPLTIDGHGVTLSGAEPCPPAGWRPWKGDVVMRDDLPFSGLLIVDGQMRFASQEYDLLKPGELCYMPTAFNRLFFRPADKTLPEIEVGQPDGTSVKLDPKAWQQSGISGVLRYNGLKAPTSVKINGADTPLVVAKDRLAPGQFSLEGKTLYCNPPQGKPLAQLTIEAVVRENGVQMGGNTAYVVVKNFNARHFYNDGYNIHNAVTKTEFYNCNATQCGDEGFSAHDVCEVTLDGAVYTYCDNAICNVNNAIVTIRNVLCAYSRHNGLEAQQQTVHRVENAILLDNPGQLGAGGSTMTADNLLIVRTAKAPATQAIGGNGIIELSRVTAAGNSGLLRYMGGTRLTLDRCLFAAGQGGIHVRLDDIVAPFALTKVTFGEGMKIDWGARPPFQVLPLDQWLTKLVAGGKGTEAAVAPMTWQEELVLGKHPGKLPAGVGCSAELYERLAAFLK